MVVELRRNKKKNIESVIKDAPIQYKQQQQQ